MKLSPLETRQLFLTALPKETVLKLHELFPQEWWIHDDFYDNNWLALQPKMKKISPPRTPHNPVKLDF
jgi:hypothetical protein